MARSQWGAALAGNVAPIAKRERQCGKNLSNAQHAIKPKRLAHGPLLSRALMAGLFALKVLKTTAHGVASIDKEGTRQ